VRFPTVDASPGLEFTKSAVEAVKKTARLDRQPVAVLIAVSIHFRFYDPLLCRALEHLYYCFQHRISFFHGTRMRSGTVTIQRNIRILNKKPAQEKP